jgi:4-amino-4-deoxy-L-arabinose transferase-like glycosyltransferase
MSADSSNVPVVASPGVTLDDADARRADHAPLAPVAWLPIGSAVAATIAVLLAVSNRYGFHRDELYFLMLPPGWGYVDQPPLTPLLARGAAALFGASQTGVRVPALLCVGLGIVLMALIARELGGGRLSQTLTAWGFAFAAVPMLTGHYMVTATVDNVVWAAALLFITRALMRDQPRWWLAAGAVVGVSFYNKLLIILLLISLAIGLAIVGPRKVFRSGWLWAGIALALVIGSPNLIYQATHHFPQLTMAGAIADPSNRIMLIPFQFLMIGVPLLSFVYAGFRGFWRRPQWRPVRALPIAYVASLVITLIGAGQIYYPFGLLAYIFAAGTVPVAEWVSQANTRSRLTRQSAYLVLNALITALIALPLLPVTVLGHTPVPALNPTVGDTIGWPTYVRTVAGVYQALPADQKAHTVLFTGNYGEAGSIVHYGQQYGLPAVYSGQNELWYHGPPPATATTVVVWDENPTYIKSRFDNCDVKATMDNGVGVDNEEQGSAVLVCQVPAGGWAALWPKLQHYD